MEVRDMLKASLSLIFSIIFLTNTNFALEGNLVKVRQMSLYSTRNSISRHNIGLSAPSDIQAKLKALDDAHKSGILTDEEYNKKKAELEAQLLESTMSEETKKRLEALESAYQSGIISKEEYERKKSEILKGITITQPKINAKLQTYTDPLWGIKFSYPSDWTVKNLPGGQGIFLTYGTSTINILLFLGNIKPNQLVDSISEQVKAQWQNYQSIQKIERKYGQQTVPVQEFTGIAPNGVNSHAQIAGFSSGGFAYVFFMSAPEDMFASVLSVWEELLNGFKPIKNGKLYAHDKGLFFWYPEDWNVAKQEDYVQFTPPNIKMQGDVPLELYFMFVDEITDESLSDPKDPRIAKYLDEQIKSIVQTLKRGEEPILVGSNALYKWEAKSPEGKIVQAYAFSKIADKKFIGLVAIGLKEQLESRDADLRRIFTSMDLSLALSSSSEPSSSEGQIGSIGSSTISPDEVGEQSWGFKFRPPVGWKSQKTGEGIILGHDTIPGMIIVMPNTDNNLNQLKKSMEEGLSEEGIMLSLKGQLRSLGNNSFSGEYEGMLNNQPVKAHGIGIVSPFNRGVYIIALTTPDKYGKEIITASNAIARSIQFFKVEASGLMQNFVGTWTNYTTNTATTITLAPNGAYYENYEASYSGKFSDSGGDDLGSWGNAGQDQSQGTWTVVGDRRQGKIIIRLQGGNENVIEYRVHEENGQTYWNEYWFNGQLYGKDIK